jgi:hypothetical protein
MKLAKPKNVNYAAVVVEITKLEEIPGMDRVQHAIIFGQSVIVSKEVAIGDMGIYFPVESRLSEEFLKENNLYRHETQNKDITVKGFFEDNGRVRCVKFRGHDSNGFYVPVDSIAFTGTQVNRGDVFDTLNDIPICQKYMVPGSNGHHSGKPGTAKKADERVIPTQFRKHCSTTNMYLVNNPFAVGQRICITPKLHGTSVIIANVLCNRKLTLRDKIARKFGASVETTEYDVLFSSRNQLRNAAPKTPEHSFYKTDVYSDVGNQIKDLIPKGYTVYGEIVGYAGQSMIQKGYDYGNLPGKCQLVVYRISITNQEGEVFEMPSASVRKWCRSNDILSVYDDAVYHVVEAGENTMEVIRAMPNMEKTCPFCDNDVPFEGYVARSDGPMFKAYKVKCNLFLGRETKQLDAGIGDGE